MATTARARCGRAPSGRGSGPGPPGSASRAPPPRRTGRPDTGSGPSRAAADPRGRVLLPVRRLRRGAQQVAEGRLDTRLDVTGNDELAGLTATFNAMAAQLQRDDAALGRRGLPRRLRDPAACPYRRGPDGGGALRLGPRRTARRGDRPAHRTGHHPAAARLAGGSPDRRRPARAAARADRHPPDRRGPRQPRRQRPAPRPAAGDPATVRLLAGIAPRPASNT
ncbi:HAMP domain-containing protein [Streptomyces sp. NPDC051555]|uniref:HAMP domain-containing protein n=1 Tax=Streptomyces sp. NPDC051555 TaxID=3365657 RepID=UPI0037A23B7D